MLGSQGHNNNDMYVPCPTTMGAVDKLWKCPAVVIVEEPREPPDALLVDQLRRASCVICAITSSHSPSSTFMRATTSFFTNFRPWSRASMLLQMSRSGANETTPALTRKRTQCLPKGSDPTRRTAESKHTGMSNSLGKGAMADRSHRNNFCRQVWLSSMPECTDFAKSDLNKTASNPAELKPHHGNTRCNECSAAAPA